MKTVLVPALFAGLVLCPTGAFAQQAPSNAPPAATAPADMHAHHRPRPDMRAFEADRTAMRSSILGALTPDHKRFLATLAGEIATAPSPDLKSATSRLDAELSPQEKTTILAAEQSMHEKMRSQFGDRGRGPRDGAHPGPSAAPGDRAGTWTPPTPDAGRIVLATMLGLGPMHGNHHMGGPGGPGGPGGHGGPPMDGRGGPPMDGAPGAAPPSGAPGPG